mmetsp:Transcript_21541/g.59875  ORF Transcript_21541/g.59875 Transcript_21541/m.59875 type:complete len:351 (-) Transcript_21541:386-1438(-)
MDGFPGGHHGAGDHHWTGGLPGRVDVPPPRRASSSPEHDDFKTLPGGTLSLNVAAGSTSPTSLSWNMIEFIHNSSGVLGSGGSGLAQPRFAAGAHQISSGGDGLPESVEELADLPGAAGLVRQQNPAHQREVEGGGLKRQPSTGHGVIDSSPSHAGVLARLGSVCPSGHQNPGNNVNETELNPRAGAADQPRLSPIPPGRTIFSQPVPLRMNNQDLARGPTSPPEPSLPGPVPAGRPPALLDNPATKSPQRPRLCLNDSCRVDLSKDKAYYKRRKLCGRCIHSFSVVVGGKEMRFCQQCSSLHGIAEFDGERRSCRKTLEKHKIRARRSRRSSRGDGAEDEPAENFGAAK